MSRDLRSSPYNERVAECREAARCLGATGDPPVLREITLEEFRRRRRVLPPLLAMRADHVLSENKRVRGAMTALQQGDLVSLGRLVTASGRSMVTLFGAGTPETSLLLALLDRTPAVLGVTLAGAGFGGNLLVLAKPGSMGAIAQAVAGPFSVRFGEAADRLAFRVVETGPAARIEAVVG